MAASPKSAVQKERERALRAEENVRVLMEAIDAAGFYPCKAKSCQCVDRWHAKNPAAFSGIAALKEAP